MHLRFLFTLLSFLFLQNDPPAGDPPANDPPKNDPPDGDVTFDNRQQEKINAMLAAERKATEDRILAKVKADREEAERREKEKRDADEAAKRGEFDKVRADLEGKVAEAESTATTLQERLDAALQAIKDDIDATWKKVPAEVTGLYDGPDDDPLAKKTFLNREATQKLIDRLTADKAATRGNGPNPKPGAATIDIDKETARKARAYRF